MPTRGPNPGLDRTRYALRVSGVPPEGTNPLRSGIHTRGYLPHVKREGSSYFVTFRLEDALPFEILMAFKRQQAAKLRQLPASDHAGLAEVNRQFHRQVERYLDR